MGHHSGTPLLPPVGDGMGAVTTAGDGSSGGRDRGRGGWLGFGGRLQSRLSPIAYLNNYVRVVTLTLDRPNN